LFVLCQPQAAAVTCQLNPVLCRVCMPSPPTPLTMHGSCVRACSQRQFRPWHLIAL